MSSFQDSSGGLSRVPGDARFDAGFDIGTAVRWAAAAAIALGGLIHLQLYFDGYRDFPNQNLGRSFILNGVASVVVACLLVARKDLLVRLAGAAILVGTLIAFVVSRTGDGIFGFAEQGLNPSPQAALTLVAEIVGLALLAATFVPRIGPGDNLRPDAAAAIAAVVLIATGVGSVLWARTPAPPEQAATSTTVAAATTSGVSTSVVPATTVAGGAPTTPTSVAPPTTPAVAAAATAAADVTAINVVDFSFDPATLEIPVGTTVRWTNNDTAVHTITAEDGSFISEDLQQGDSFEFTFTTAGTFPYVCGIHPSMTASITVTG